MKRLLSPAILFSTLVSVAYSQNISYDTGNTSYSVTSNPSWGGYSYLFIGSTTANNALTISNGAKGVMASNFTVGLNVPASGNSFTITGAGSSLSYGGGFNVGSAGATNSLSILNGGKLTYTGPTGTNGQSMVGYNAASSGNSVRVDGAGSTLSTVSLFVGYGGSSNTMRVENGGVANMENFFYVGRLGNANNNTTTITGTGSLLTSKAVYVGFSGVSNSGNSLNIGSGGSIKTGSVYVTTGNSLNLNSGGTLEVPALGSLTNGYGTINLAGGTVKVTSAGTSGSNTAGLTLADATTSTFDIGTGLSMTHAGVIQGAGSLQKSGAGTLNLTTTNSFTGSLTISAGTLALSSNGTLVPSGITNNGALRLERGNVNLAAPISGSGSFTTTTGSNTLSGVNTYTGQTSIEGGTLTFAKKNSLYNGAAANWVPSKITVASGATMALRVGGADEFEATDVQTLLNGSHLGGSTSTTGLLAGSRLGLDTTNAAGGLFEYSGNITNTGAGAFTLVKLGTNTLKLSGTNNYTGGTVVQGGWLTSNSAASLGTNGLTLSGGGSSGFIYGSAFDLPAVTLVSPGGALDTNGYDVSLNNGISGSSGLTKTGAGTLTIPASIGTTALGTLTASAGTLKISNTVTGSSQLILQGPSGGADVDIDGGTVTRSSVSIASSTALSGHNLTVRNGGSLTASQLIYGNNSTAVTNNSVTITGKNGGGVASSANVGTTNVGSAGSDNTLTVSAGGQLQSTAATIGGGNSVNVSMGQNNSVSITGEGSLWTLSSTLMVGQYGSGNVLSISDGGRVSATASTGNVIVVGAGLNNSDAYGNDNTLVISGANSSLATSGNVVIGGSSPTALSTGNAIELVDGGLLVTGDAVTDTLTIRAGNHLRLDGGYFAIYGDRLSEIQGFIDAMGIQVSQNGGWVTATGGDLEFTYFADSDEGDALAKSFTGGLYDNLGGYTIVGTVPEPSALLLLGIGGAALAGFRRRQARA